MFDNDTKTFVLRLPNCCMCSRPAKYDAASFTGQWGYFCEHHFQLLTPGKLGLGRGQELIIKSKEQQNG